MGDLTNFPMKWISNFEYFFKMFRHAGFFHLLVNMFPKFWTKLRYISEDSTVLGLTNLSAIMISVKNDIKFGSNPNYNIISALSTLTFTSRYEASPNTMQFPTSIIIESLILQILNPMYLTNQNLFSCFNILQ